MYKLDERTERNPSQKFLSICFSTVSVRWEKKWQKSVSNCFFFHSACDIDGDGREEIYFLNTNTYSGASSTGELDKLFRFNDESGKFEDILSKDYNIGVLKNLAGRSVACIDRKGNKIIN